MHRFFVDDAGFQGEVVCLDETDARHARRVLRLRPGEEVVLMDGARRFRGEILDGTGEAVACRLLEEEGLLESRAGAKSCISVTDELREKVRAELVRADAVAAASAFRRMGVPLEEALELVRRDYEEEMI